MITPDARIGYATRILQNMLDAGDIGFLPTDTEDRFREMLATLREAQNEVVDMRVDRQRRRWDGDPITARKFITAKARAGLLNAEPGTLVWFDLPVAGAARQPCIQAVNAVAASIFGVGNYRIETETHRMAVVGIAP